MSLQSFISGVNDENNAANQAKLIEYDFIFNNDFNCLLGFKEELTESLKADRLSMVVLNSLYCHYLEKENGELKTGITNLNEEIVGLSETARNCQNETDKTTKRLQDVHDAHKQAEFEYQESLSRILLDNEQLKEDYQFYTNKINEMAEDRMKIVSLLRKYKRNARTVRAQLNVSTGRPGSNNTASTLGGFAVCQNCGIEFLENENFNWSCCQHTLSYSGYIWYCCGLLNNDAPGCVVQKHVSKNEHILFDVFTSTRSLSNTNSIAGRRVSNSVPSSGSLNTSSTLWHYCYCCLSMSQSHDRFTCRFDPNIRISHLSDLSNSKILESEEKRIVNEDKTSTFQLQSTVQLDPRSNRMNMSKFDSIAAHLWMKDKKVKREDDHIKYSILTHLNKLPSDEEIKSDQPVLSQEEITNIFSKRLNADLSENNLWMDYTNFIYNYTPKIQRRVSNIGNEYSDLSQSLSNQFDPVGSDNSQLFV